MSAYRRHIALAAILLAGFRAPQDGAGPQPLPPALADRDDIVIEYYDVSGDTAQALRAAINAARPTDTHDGKPVDARTQVRFQWRWQTTPGSCDLERAQVHLRATVLLPRVTNYASLPKALRARWLSYLTILGEHEAGHVDIARRGIPAVRDAIAGADCDTAQQAARSAAAAISQAQIAYDAETRHGAMQGATFP